ncbi:MAG: hypothetical protein MN733_01785 [Nitrososphaera sp.]|nr:hypothetical protein [Nitrososphaera sp.]
MDPKRKLDVLWTLAIIGAFLVCACSWAFTGQLAIWEIVATAASILWFATFGIWFNYEQRLNDLTTRSGLDDR